MIVADDRPYGGKPLPRPDSYTRSAFTSINTMRECEGRSWQDKVAFYVVDWPLIDLKIRIAATDGFFVRLLWGILYFVILIYGACSIICIYTLSVLVNGVIDAYYVLTAIF